MKKIKFNSDWKFNLGTGKSFGNVMENSQEEKKITLPHDASVLRPRDENDVNGSGNGFFREENCHYIKEFSLDKKDSDKNIWLEFEGVYQNSFVYVNNAFVGKCPYGYSNYYLDITEYVTFESHNTIKVIVKNGVPSGRWYTGSGIYRDVNLMIADRLHIMPDGVKISARSVEEDIAAIRVETEIGYSGIRMREAYLVAELMDEEQVVASERIRITVKERTQQSYQLTMFVASPKLWDAEHPFLYKYRVWIEEQGEKTDEEEGTYGIRGLQLDTLHGLRVNGKTVKLRGGCIHHDNGIIGASEYLHAAEERVRKLKEAGYNAIRSSHYPMSRKLLEACDRIGMYVMDEYSDVWTSTKVAFDYGIHMTEWWEHDITNMIRKDYNHPCVIMYSIGNEIPEVGNCHDVQFGKKLADTVRRLDDTRYVTNNMNLMLSVMDRMGEIMQEATQKQSDEQEGQEINSLMNDIGGLLDYVMTSKIAEEATEEATGQVDIVGYNYAASRYETDGIRYPNRILVGSETSPADLDKNWELVERLPYVIGDFGWTAWDYLGEAGIGVVHYGELDGSSFYAKYPCKAAYCGDFNLIGDRRPVSYWREIIWGLRKEPYIAVQTPQHYGEQHNLSLWSMTDAIRSWNWSGYEEKPVRVEVYTPDEEAELYVNGELVERKTVGTKRKCYVYFDTVYKPGKIEVITYSEGVEMARDSVKTAEAQMVLRVNADSNCIPADKSDICYVDVAVCDRKGVLNPDANVTVSINLEGPGKVLGFGSADPESTENYYDLNAVTYEGRLRAAVRGTGEKGLVCVTFSGENMETAKIMIEAI